MRRVATTACSGAIIDTFEVGTGNREIQTVRVARSPNAPAMARILLLPAGEGSNPGLGDGFALAVEWLRKSSVPAEIAYPGFRRPPGWYADRPENGRLPETAVLELVRHWRNTHALPLYLMGFSKSGYAALSLLIRHSGQLFCGAAVWDAPLMLQKISSNSMLESYGHAGAFDMYRVDRRVRELKAVVDDHNARLVLCGFNIWGQQMRGYHRLLVEADVPHDYWESKHGWHRWDESWMNLCLETLLRPSEITPARASDPPASGCAKCGARE